MKKINFKLFLDIFLLLASGFIFSQDSFSMPDYQLIKKNIEDKNSKLYYPKLIQRLAENDTLFTKDEYVHLYYGSALQKDYDPYQRTVNQDKFMKYYEGDEIKKEDCAEIIKLADESFKKFPLDLTLMDFMRYVYHVNGDQVKAKKINSIIDGLISTILYSGDGVKCETGMHVVSISHEYAILNLFKLERISQSMKGNCDYIEIEKGKLKIDGLYFDITMLRKKDKVMYGEK